ncbi:MAG: ubiquinone/menaquinone biosynthesis methyltransferase [Gammaproteobacteria bacterium]
MQYNANKSSQQPAQAHRQKVQQVFKQAAPHYDLMNDAMTIGGHRILKKILIDLSTIRSHHSVLDLAAGTCDLSLKIRPRLKQASLIAADPNMEMLLTGRNRLINAGWPDVPMVRATAESLPFANDSFNRILIGFGLRNFSDKATAFKEILRCLMPAGLVTVLELSQPTAPLGRKLYDAISETALPLLGRIMAGDTNSYRYLHESIRAHPSPEAISSMMDAAGLVQCRFLRIAGGIFCLHSGYKP